MRLWSLLTIVSVLAAHPARGEEKVFRAGAATSNITPPLGQLIIGNFGTPVATHVHDELHARCVVLDDGTNILAFAICDNLGIGRPVLDEARRLVREEIGIPEAHLLLASTHTHSATSAGWISLPDPGKEMTDYHRFVARRIADGIRRAWNNREPAEIGWGSVDVPNQVFNRRWLFQPGSKPPLNPFGEQDTAMMNPGYNRPGLSEPAGPTDPQVSFVSIRSTSGRPIALMANYSLHYIGGVPQGHISADYFAAFARHIARKLDAERLEPPFVGIMTNGTSGDCNNVDYRSKPTAAMPPYAKIEAVAGEVADAVFGALPSITYTRQAPLAAARKDLTLANRIPTPAQVEYAKSMLAKPEGAKPVHGNERAYATRVLSLVDAPATVDVPLQAVRIGDLAIAAIPFETFAETGLAIKKASPFPRTFTIELAGGSYGYLPTPRQHALGGYETWLGTNRVEVAASDKIEATILDLLRSLKPAPGGAAKP
ncbi:hypothetical protein TA3x_002208 [Tundrisphaera sp. TA3]|uniref:hypothetical protein n=1 Tax=Tundrisphaera sp. TA3 TaxID=3435775 RepID=UPI003EBDDC7D